MSTVTYEAFESWTDLSTLSTLNHSEYIIQNLGNNDILVSKSGAIPQDNTGFVLKRFEKIYFKLSKDEDIYVKTINGKSKIAINERV